MSSSQPPTGGIPVPPANNAAPVSGAPIAVTQDYSHDEALGSHKPGQAPPPKAIVNSRQTITDSDQPTTNGETHQPTRPSYSHIYSPAPPLATSRYNRQLLIPSISLAGHQRIARSKILIIGLGGLGSPASLYLAGAGVGTLGLMDDDKVELTNLHRQIVHSEASVRDGLSKVESAVRACRALNGEVEIVGHETRCDVSVPGAGERLFRVVDGYDVVLDCTDNPATRYLISDVCVLLGKILVSGAAQRLEGQLCLLNYPVSRGGQGPDGGKGFEKGQVSSEVRGPCYRCVFPTPPSPEMVKGCGEIGILGPVVGTIGTLMASEALRFVVKGVEEGRKPSMLLYNAWSTDPRGMFRNISLRGRRNDCVACGDDETLGEKGRKRITKEEVMEGEWNYVRFCGVVEDVKVLKTSERVVAADFFRIPHGTSVKDIQEQQPQWTKSIVIDVREPHEVEIGPKIGGSLNFPLSKILQQDDSIEEMDSLLQDGERNAMVFVCQQGNDSQIAAKRLLSFRNKGTDKSKTQDVQDVQDVFIGDIVGGFTAIEKVVI